MIKKSLRFAWRGLSHLTRITLVSAAVLALAGTALLLGMRYWVLPDIERYHDVITSSLSQAIGQPVSIGKIEADWPGLRPHLQLNDVRIFDKDKQQQLALVLQRVEGVVSWASLLQGEVRLHSLELYQPDLLLRRDTQGLMYIAGVPLSKTTPEANLADLLLRQSQIVVRDARVTWQDDMRAAPPLVFDHMEVFIDNSGRRHRFALRALPPPQLSALIDVRGDFNGLSFDDLKVWHGQLYTQLDYADVAAWRTWLSLPAGFKRGKGALRSWLQVADGKVDQLTADLALADVQAQWADDLPPLDMRILSGRISWQNVAQGFEISTRGLSLQMSNGLSLRPTDFYLRHVAANGAQPARGELRANILELAHLASLTDSLPLESGLKKQLAEFAPQGTLSDVQTKWEGDAGKLLHYEVKTHFDQLSLKQTAKSPGFSGLSGEVDGNDSSGTLSLFAHKLTVDAPQIMPEPLAFDTFTAHSSWQSNKQGMEVKFSNVAASNADLAGTVNGRYQTLPNSPGRLDLDVNLIRADVRHTDRYIPLVALNKETHDWLRAALLDGQADEFHLRLNGDLNDFPFPENKRGVFEIKARAKGVVVNYDKEWPRIENGIGELLIQGNRLQVTVPSATLEGARLQNVSVVMPDMAGPDLLLQIRGEAAGETAHSLDFIQHSPVRGYIDGFTDNVTAQGSGNLALRLDIPLRGKNPVTVAGTYRFLDNELQLDDGVPTLYKVNGDLTFTESSLRARNVSAQILGGPAMLTVQSGANGTVLANIHGHADMDTLRQNVSQPLLSYLRGGSDWDAEIKVQKKQSEVVVTSNLNGLGSYLPAPFDKSPDEVIPLRFEIKGMTALQDVVSLQYGKLVGARFLRRQEGGDWVIKRGTVNFGGSARLQNREGVWLSGTLPLISLEDWVKLSNTSDGGAPFAIAGANLQIQKLDAYGHGVSDLRINARNQNGVLTAQLGAKEINGEVSWQAQNKGKLVARLKNLTLGAGDRGKRDGLGKSAVADNATTTEFPALDLMVDELTWKDKQLGRMQLLARQHGRDWLLESMRLTNPDGVLSADGKYHMTSGEAQTQVNLKLEISDAGKMLARSGYPNSVKNGSGKLEGEFVWRGSPDDFSYATLDGMLKLDTGKGQFLKIEPGIGKLLGILSLQALPKHITLDFTDVFSEGFQFDSITGSAQIKHGVMTTNDFKIDGSSAKVTMQGQVDLNRETQDLRIRILPTVGNSVSLLGAFAAGPVVGLSTFLVSKLLRDPLDKLVSFEYNVTGTWINPNVVKVGQSTTASGNKELTP